MKQNHKKTVKKFILLLAIFAVYFLYLSFKFGASSGFILTFLTWSFFVLCTPVADAGFLLDFPLRFFIGFRMFISEIFVWVVAIFGNIICLAFFSRYYEKTFLTKLFYKILLTPYPYWAIIFLSMIGTFLSIKFGDDVYDLVSKKNRGLGKVSFKVKFLVFASIFMMTIFVYSRLLKSLGIEIG